MRSHNPVTENRSLRGFETSASATAKPATNDGRRAHSADSVLIVCDDPEFARAVVARWQQERAVPGFTLLGSELPGGATSAEYSLAIVGPNAGRSPALLSALEAAGAAVVWVTAEENLPHLRAQHPRALLVRQLDGWLDVLIQLALEVLRGQESLRRLQRAERLLAESNRHATLGLFMLEMRHSLNNCLTSVLGNAELLLLEPGRLNAQSREQIQTVHNMALRMHEVLQRFSSLETELQVAECESHSETAVPSHASDSRD